MSIVKTVKHFLQNGIHQQKNGIQAKICEACGCWGKDDPNGPLLCSHSKGGRYCNENQKFLKFNYLSYQEVLVHLYDNEERYKELIAFIENVEAEKMDQLYYYGSIRLIKK